MTSGELRRALRALPGARRFGRPLLKQLGLLQRWALLGSRQNEEVDPAVFLPIMYRHWTEVVGINRRTAEDWLRTALDYDRYEYDISEIERRVGSLAGRRVLDVGCGWGTFLMLLCRKGASMDACDLPAAHLEVARIRAPKARVVRDDARKLEAYADASFDVVLEHDVFEHVGGYERQTGPMGPSRQDKLQNLLALKRVLRPGGRGFLSTGNFAFPFNGEVQLWAVHWLPPEYQERYLKSVGVDSDRYWLCTWAEARELFAEAGLVIEHVGTPGPAAADFRDRFMSCLKGEPGVNAAFGEILGELMSTRPEFMPSWLIFFRKPETTSP